MHEGAVSKSNSEEEVKVLSKDENGFPQGGNSDRQTTWGFITRKKRKAKTAWLEGFMRDGRLTRVFAQWGHESENAS